jgi:hypothetical protein
MNAKEKLSAIMGHAERQGRYRLTLGTTETESFVGYEFGREAPDSPMYGGASYGIGDTLDEALDQVIDEVGIILR